MSEDGPKRLRARRASLFGLLPVLAAAILPLGRWGREYSGLGKLLGGEVPWWLLVGLMLLFVAFIEKRPFSSVGFRQPGWRDIPAGIATAVVSVLGIALIYAILLPALHLQLNKGAMQGLLQTPLWYRVLLVSRAAVAEELLFRGYAISRIEELTGSRLVAGVVTWGAFTYAHLSYWGAAQLIVAGWAGLLLTILFLWRRNLWANILAHWLTDGVGFLLT